MKNNLYIESHGFQVLEKDIVDKAKEIWKNDGNKVKDLLSMDLYYKPDEKKCYYVFNETIKGYFEV